MNLTQTVGSRRDFFRGTARYTFITLITAATAWISRTRTGRVCEKRNPCGGCPVFPGCDLPKADLTRRELRISSRTDWSADIPVRIAGAADSEADRNVRAPKYYQIGTIGGRS